MSKWVNGSLDVLSHNSIMMCFCFILMTLNYCFSRSISVERSLRGTQRPFEVGNYLDEGT